MPGAAATNSWAKTLQCDVGGGLSSSQDIAHDDDRIDSHGGMWTLRNSLDSSVDSCFLQSRIVILMKFLYLVECDCFQPLCTVISSVHFLFISNWVINGL